MEKTEFIEYISKNRKKLYAIAYAILGNEMDAEDAVGNAILRGYEHLDQLKDASKIRSWMTVITKNEAIKIKQKGMILPGDEMLENFLEPVKDHYSELWDIVLKLKEEFRLVVVLYYYSELSIKEIGQVLEIPAGTVKSRLKRGRDFLKKELEGGDIYESK